MPVIGDPRRFAVRYSDELQHAFWLFGKLCFVIRGEDVGAHERGTSINVAAASFEGALNLAGRRGNAALFNLPAERFFAHVDGQLYGESSTDPFSLWNLVARPACDAFDYYKIYLVENDLVGRLIWNQRDGESDTPVREAVLRAGEYDEVLAAFVDEIDERYPRWRDPAYRDR